MKLKIEFGQDTRFDQPIGGTFPAPVKWVPNFRERLRAAARAERQRPIRRRVD